MQVANEVSGKFRRSSRNQKALKTMKYEPSWQRGSEPTAPVKMTAGLKNRVSRERERESTAELLLKIKYHAVLAKAVKLHGCFDELVRGLFFTTTFRLHSPTKYFHITYIPISQWHYCPHIHILVASSLRPRRFDDGLIPNYFSRQL